MVFNIDVGGTVRVSVSSDLDVNVQKHFKLLSRTADALNNMLITCVDGIGICRPKRRQIGVGHACTSTIQKDMCQ